MEMAAVDLGRCSAENMMGVAWADMFARGCLSL